MEKYFIYFPTSVLLVDVCGTVLSRVFDPVNIEKIDVFMDDVAVFQLLTLYIYIYCMSIYLKMYIIESFTMKCITLHVCDSINWELFYWLGQSCGRQMKPDILLLLYNYKYHINILTCLFGSLVHFPVECRNKSIHELMA